MPSLPNESLPERRYLAGELSVDPIADGQSTKIVGYAAVFNSPSEPLPLSPHDKRGRSFREIVRPGAFADSLNSQRDIIAAGEHRNVLGRTANGTLRLSEDGRGLKYEIDPPNTQYARDIIELIRRRDVPQSSFSFRVNPGGDAWSRDGQELIRELRSVELLDVGPTAAGAYRASEVSLRSLLDCGLLDEDERHAVLMTMRLALASRD